MARARMRHLHKSKEADSRLDANILEGGSSEAAYVRLLRSLRTCSGFVILCIDSKCDGSLAPFIST